MTGSYEMNVHAHPETGASLDDVLEVAVRCGFSGVLINNHSDCYDESILKSHISDKNSNLVVLSGVEIKENNPNKLRGRVQAYCNKTDVITVHGGDDNINRAALENPRVDVLCHPETANGSGINHVLARLAAKNKVAMEFSMHPIIHQRGGQRSKAITYMRRNLMLARKYRVMMTLTACPRSICDFRAARELVALASIIGMTKEEAVQALTVTPKTLIDKKNSHFGNL